MDGAMTGETQANISKGEIIEFSCQIVVSYVGNNSLGASDIPDVIEKVHRSLEGLSAAPSTTDTKQTPAVSIRRSVTPDYVICLEDGKKLKMLKRYLRTRYGLTPEQYREKWGLRSEYPMVAPNYSAQRAAFAKKFGLGKKRPAARKSRKKRSG